MLPLSSCLVMVKMKNKLTFVMMSDSKFLFGMPN